MNPRNLSSELFSIINHRYKYNNHIWSHLHDSLRYDKYGSCQSYNGRGFCGVISYSLKDYLTSNNIFDNVRICTTQKDIEQITKLGLSYSDHIFLKALNKDNQQLIIDGTYKQLFITKRCPVEKVFSPYANILYNLPPVFIGTYDDLYKLMCCLQKWKNADSLHIQDSFITDWYSETKYQNE